MRATSIIALTVGIVALAFGLFNLWAISQQGAWALCQVVGPPSEWSGDEVELAEWEIAAWPIGPDCGWVNLDADNAVATSRTDDLSATVSIYGGLLLVAVGTTDLVVSRHRKSTS